MTTPSRSDRLARRIMWGLVIGLALGLLGRGLIAMAPNLATHTNWISKEVLDPFGQIFLRMLFFVVVPLVFASLALGVVQLGRLEKLGPLAARTFVLFGVNMAIGVALGLAMMNLAKPGASISDAKRAQLVEEFKGEAKNLETKAAEQPNVSFRSLVEMFLPRNLLKSVTDFQLLPLILFALLVGTAGTQLGEHQRTKLQSALEIINDLMTQIVRFALTLAPFAVAALLASVIM